MLDAIELIRQLHQKADLLFTDEHKQAQDLQRLWEGILADIRTTADLKTDQKQQAIPAWEGDLSAIFAITPLKSSAEYAVAAIDGSQIYPDRHQGTTCFLINIGEVVFKYGEGEMLRSSFSARSIPHLFVPESGGREFSPDWVNAKRQELEFQAAVQCAQSSSVVTLLDGSLIFWHLEGKDDEWAQEFVPHYNESLLKFYKNRWLIASYISLPHSKDLVRLIEFWLAAYNPSLVDKELSQTLERSVDRDIIQFFIPPFHRTTVFESRSSMVQVYPLCLRPHFFYAHIGCEVVRIEIPAWIAREQACVEAIASLILDQVHKGNGYPIALAEAHEQAVVKAADRDFFYQAIAKLGAQKNIFWRPSKKSFYKRFLGI
jgi:hypothetical protein